MQLAPLVVLLLALASPAEAQEDVTAVALVNAPIYLMPDASRTPLRVAAIGTVFAVLAEQGDWTQVSFRDPQFGDRMGYVQTKAIRFRRPELQPMDLSVAPPSKPPARPTTAARVDTKPPPPAAAESRPQLRQGFWFNVGLGYGSLGCEDCEDRLGGASGNLSLGGTVGNRVLLGVGTTGWYKSEDFQTLTVGTLDARLRVYPSLRSGFFLTGGLGVGSIVDEVFDITTTDTGVGLMLGLGWDIRVGRNVSITPFWNGVAVGSEDADANFGQIGLGITIH